MIMKQCCVKRWQPGSVFESTTPHFSVIGKYTPIYLHRRRMAFHCGEMEGRIIELVPFLDRHPYLVILHQQLQRREVAFVFVKCISRTRTATGKIKVSPLLYSFCDNVCDDSAFPLRFMR